MSNEFYIGPGYDDRSIAGKQYDADPILPKPATKATVKVVPVPEVPLAPEQ